MDEKFWNEDSTKGAQRHIRSGSVDLVLTDPPYGIEGMTFDKHYNRDEKNVISGYVDVAAENYASFSDEWVEQVARMLKKGGVFICVSGYSHLNAIVQAAQRHGLEERSHIIWKFPFGVWTTQKYVSSHYHILVYQKPGGSRKLNTKNLPNGDVWKISKEYQRGKKKNINQLPTTLLKHLISMGSQKGDLVVDMFLGSFSTARVAKSMGRRVAGFELNTKAFNFGKEQFKKPVPQLPPSLSDLPPMSKRCRASKSPKPSASDAVSLKTLERYKDASQSLIIYWSTTGPSSEWFDEAHRVLTKGGSLYVVAMTTKQMSHTLNKLTAASFEPVNHIIWQHNPCPTKPLQKTFYHILFYQKKGKRVFHTTSRFRMDDKDKSGSKNYRDREDVWGTQNLMTWSQVKSKIKSYSKV